MKNSSTKISRGSGQRATRRQAGWRQISAELVTVCLIFLCIIFVLPPPAHAYERKGMVTGFCLGYMPYAEVKESSGQPYTSESFSILAGYAFADHHIAALLGEFALSAAAGSSHSVNFIGAIYRYYFSPSPNSFQLSGGIGTTATSYHSRGFGPSLSIDFGPAVYAGCGYVLLGQIQVNAAYSVGHTSVLTKKYISLTVGLIVFK